MCCCPPSQQARGGAAGSELGDVVAAAPAPRPPEAQRTPGEGATARVAKIPGAEEASRGGNDGTPSRSCPVSKRKNFVSRARATPLRCVALSRPKPKEANYAVPRRDATRRAAPTGAARAPGWLGPPPVRQSRAD